MLQICLRALIQFSERDIRAAEDGVQPGNAARAEQSPQAYDGC